MLRQRMFLVSDKAKPGLRYKALPYTEALKEASARFCANGNRDDS
jgi:hypothetical protein